MPAKLIPASATRPKLWRKSGEWLHIAEPNHPFEQLGFNSPTGFLNWPGEIISGHPERHVRQVRWNDDAGDRTAYLKVEHLIGWRTRWRNCCAGFGWTSRSEREATLLKWLENQGVSVPHVLASGEDGLGRAFVLVDRVPGVELREWLTSASAESRRTVALRLAEYLVEVQTLNCLPADFSAKHVFVTDKGLTLIDWQNARLGQRFTTHQTAELWGTMLASLGQVELVEMATRHYSYLTETNFDELWPLIQRIASKRASRSSIRDQRANLDTPSSRLAWLAGEAVCVIPELVPHWPSEVMAAPFYRDAGSQRAEWVTVGNVSGWVQRFHECDPLSRWHAAWRGRSWRSRGVTAGRVLMHLQRHGVPSVRLLAFGQRLTSHCHAESFIYFEADSQAVSLPIRLVDRRMMAPKRCALLRQAGAVVRALHDSGARLSQELTPVFSVGQSLDSRVILRSADVVRLDKHLTLQQRLHDLLWLNQQEWPILNQADRRAVLAGYLLAGPLANSRPLLRSAL